MNSKPVSRNLTTTREHVDLRPFDNSADRSAALRLINLDRLPGQPEVTGALLGDALAGRSEIDGAWWAALHSRYAITATAGGRVRGLMAFADSKDGYRYLLWLHANEDPAVIAALVEYFAQGRLPQRAFWFATALTTGVEGLPAEHRPATHEALVGHGFTGHDYWLYMRGPTAPYAERPAEVIELDHGRAWHLVLREAGREIGRAEVSLGTRTAAAPGTGVLWWISVDEHVRGRGLGRRLLAHALAVLHEAGAREAVLFVDHDDPLNRSREAAIKLYERFGFVVIDRLWSYERTVGSSTTRSLGSM